MIGAALQAKTRANRKVRVKVGRRFRRFAAANWLEGMQAGTLGVLVTESTESSEDGP